MSLKVIGALLVIIVCGSTGYKLSSAYCLQERQLEQLIQALEYIKCELQYRQTSLPSIFQQCAAMTGGAASAYFLMLSSELASQNTPDAGACVNVVLANSKGLSLAAVDTLTHMGQTLGNFDLQGQLTCLDDTITFARNKLNHFKVNHVMKTRNYQTLGLCAGVALVILFI